jgi:hypothetical protein
MFQKDAYTQGEKFCIIIFADDTSVIISNKNFDDFCAT